MNKSINRSFIKLQSWWFSIFLIGVIAGALYQVIGGSQSMNSVMFSLWQYVKIFYLPGALIILLFHCLFLMIIPLQLYFYYYIWIKRIYGTLKRWVQFPYSNFKGRLAHWLLCRFFNDYCDTLILRSFFLKECPLPKEYSNKVQEISFENRPILIHREHLLEKSFWPKWAFATVLLFNKLIIQRYHARHGEIKYRLKVDLRNQSHGIYNNAGKHIQPPYLTSLVPISLVSIISLITFKTSSNFSGLILPTTISPLLVGAIKLLFAVKILYGLITLSFLRYPDSRSSFFNGTL